MAFANRSLKGSSRLRKKTCKTVPSVEIKASNHLKGPSSLVLRGGPGVRALEFPCLSW